MERNQNGMPRMEEAMDRGRTQNGMPRMPEGCSRGSGYNMSTDENRIRNGAVNEGDGISHNHTCGGDGSCLDDMPLAYVYAPSQKFRMLYSAADALKHGTLFEELYKPMGVYGNE